MNKLLSFILINSIILSLVGCSSNVESKNNKALEEDGITVVYFKNWENKSKAEIYEEKDAYESLNKKYEKLNKEKITIKALIKEDLYKIKTKVIFDENYNASEFEKDVDQMVNRVNLELNEIF